MGTVCAVGCWIVAISLASHSPTPPCVSINDVRLCLIFFCFRWLLSWYRSRWVCVCACGSLERRGGRSAGVLGECNIINFIIFIFLVRLVVVCVLMVEHQHTWEEFSENRCRRGHLIRHSMATSLSMWKDHVYHIWINRIEYDLLESTERDRNNWGLRLTGWRNISPPFVYQVRVGVVYLEWKTVFFFALKWSA